MECGKGPQILLAGYSQEYQVGMHLLNAAHELSFPTVFADVNDAFKGNKLIQSFLWRFWGRYPQNLFSFNQKILEKCKNNSFTHLITVGIAPVTLESLVKIGRMGVKRINFLTDDPWNPFHRAPWFIKALKGYDHIYSPRTSNLNDLKACGCNAVDYLPFAFAQSHMLKDGIFPPEGETDVVFVGGGDHDRFPFTLRLQEMGIQLALYGAGWEKFPILKKSWKGKGDVDTIKSVTGTSKVTLCLVRKANRDGHVMRSFEAAASGACLLVEETTEHRNIFGNQGDCVVYFTSLNDMEKKIKELLDNPIKRLKLRKAVFDRVTKHGNNYSDRLKIMIGG